MLKTGINELDEKINGLNEKELITIASRPGIGKSAVGISIINNVVEQTNNKILYFNLETSKDILKDKILNDRVEIIDDINNIEDIKNICEERKYIDLVLIDYFQLITESKLYEKSSISSVLKSLATTLDIPVVVLSQLNRTYDERGDKYFKQEDLNIALQQDSDKIIFLYSDNKSLEDLEFVIAKI